jgi:general secretion pathway protein J
MHRARHSEARRAGGFTLIEMVIAITILAIIALISWRSLSGIVRGQHALSAVVADTRELDRVFEQLDYDFGEIVPDAALGEPAVAFDGGGLRLVRALREARQPTRWQVVRYRVENGMLLRLASAPLNNRDAVRDALSSGNAVERQVLVTHASRLEVRGWVPGQGWAARSADVKRGTPPRAGMGPILPPNAIGGLEVTVTAGGLDTPYVRLVLPSP